MGDDFFIPLLYLGVQFMLQASRANFSMILFVLNDLHDMVHILVFVPSFCTVSLFLPLFKVLLASLYSANKHLHVN